MDFITVRSIGGSIWSFRKDRIEMISERYTFSENDIENIPQLKTRKSCAIIKLIGNNSEYFCDNPYNEIMSLLNE